MRVVQRGVGRGAFIVGAPLSRSIPRTGGTASLRTSPTQHPLRAASQAGGNWPTGCFPKTNATTASPLPGTALTIGERDRAAIKLVVLPESTFVADLQQVAPFGPDRTLGW